MRTIRNSINKLNQNTLVFDKFIKLVEYVRGLYRYPKRMMGRNLPHNLNRKSHILVFAAHPDDEILGIGTTLYRHRVNNDKVTISYVTNGAGYKCPSWRLKARISQTVTEVRYKEGVQALSLMGIPKENIFCLGYPDAGTHRYMESIASDIQQLIQKLQPKKVYVHCIEGGHGDHDIISFIVKSVCFKMGYFNVFEWTEYNALQPIGANEVNFSSSRHNNNEALIIDISEKERILKRKMLAYHDSQNVERFFMQGEAIRQANTNELDKEILKYSQFPKKRLKLITRKFTKFLDENIRMSI